MRRCETCGTSLEGRSPRARYCSDVCRTRGKRGHRAPAVVVDLPVDVVEERGADESDEGPSLEEIAAELRRTLRDRATPASAKAGLARELRATMEAIDALKPKAKDAVDELFEKRAARGLA